MAIKEVLVPDIGNFDSVDVIDILVKEGDTVAKDDSLITLESDKASMDIPAPFGGIVKSIGMKVGDKAAQGNLILTLDAAEDSAPTEKAAAPAKAEPAKAEPVKAETTATVAIPEPSRPAPEVPKVIQPQATPNPIGASSVADNGKAAHASPSVRKFARELGVNLKLVSGTGPKNRITQEDVQAYVKGELAKPR